jgi:hypothetical protein
MRAFVGIDLGREPVPDETTVMRLRHLLGAQWARGEDLRGGRSGPAPSRVQGLEGLDRGRYDHRRPEFDETR